MWLVTRHGFYSIVRAHTEAGEPHPELMLIRARKHAHLVNPKRLHSGLNKLLSKKRRRGAQQTYRGK